jgi:hypothetical protein
LVVKKYLLSDFCKNYFRLGFIIENINWEKRTKIRYALKPYILISTRTYVNVFLCFLCSMSFTMQMIIYLSPFSDNLCCLSEAKFFLLQHVCIRYKQIHLVFFLPFYFLIVQTILNYLTKFKKTTVSISNCAFNFFSSSSETFHNDNGFNTTENIAF